MKIYGKIQKYSNNLNRCVFGDTLHIKFQRIPAFRTTTKYIFSNYGVILQIYEKNTNKNIWPDLPVAHRYCCAPQVMRLPVAHGPVCHR